MKEGVSEIGFRNPHIRSETYHSWGLRLFFGVAGKGGFPKCRTVRNRPERARRLSASQPDKRKRYRHPDKRSGGCDDYIEDQARRTGKPVGQS